MEKRKKWLQFEAEKQKLITKGLSSEKLEKSIKKLCKKLKI